MTPGDLPHRHAGTHIQSSRRAIHHRLQQAVMFGLAVGQPGDIVRKHREIVRRDRVALPVGPVAGRDSSQAERAYWRWPGSCQQLCRHTACCSGIGKPRAQRMHCRAMLRRSWCRTAPRPKTTRVAPSGFEGDRERGSRTRPDGETGRVSIAKAALRRLRNVR